MRGFPKRHEHQLKPIEGARHRANEVGVVVLTAVFTVVWTMLDSLKLLFKIS